MPLFDLTVYSLSFEAGRERNELPGLYLTAAPRGAARMRGQDLLAMYCRMRLIAPTGTVTDSPLTPAQMQEILTRLAETYFKAAGSVTSGLRAVASRLNDYLLARNLRHSQEGQLAGVMNMAVIHGDTVMVAHGGATHTFALLKNQALHFDDGQGTRGLGLSRQAVPRFYQTKLETGDVLVFCPEPPGAWNVKSMASSGQLSMDLLRRKMLSDAGVSLQAAVIRVQPGKGQISFWKSTEGEARVPQSVRPAGTAVSSQPVPLQRAPVQPPAQAQPAAPPAAEEPLVQATAEQTAGALNQIVDSGLEAETTQPAADLSADAVEKGSGAVFLGASLIEQQPASETASLEPESQPLRERPARPQTAAQTSRAGSVLGRFERPRSAAPAVDEAPAGAPAAKSAGEQAAARRQKPAPAQKPKRNPVTFRPVVEPVRHGLAALRRGTLSFRAKAGRGLASAAGKVLPRRPQHAPASEPFFNLSPSWMLMVAIVVPLMVVAVGATVYARAGRSEQMRILMSQIQQSAAQAEQQTDPVAARQSWAQLYEMVTSAEKRYGESDESTTIRKQALSRLDALEGYIRLEFKEAAPGSFANDVNITRMETTLNDIYMLDTGQGRILHLIRTADGYEMDQSFICGNGKAGELEIGPIVDMVTLPVPNELDATVMGVDQNGKLVYCSPSNTGFDSLPLVAPDAGWGQVIGMTLSGSTLYVLDPSKNAVYYYDGLNGMFSDPPHLYFADQIPQMNDVIDLAVDQEFLYMLHADGRMTICESSYITTRCTDPAPYGDSRPGYEPSPLNFVGTRFTQIVTTQPPEPSLFALDAQNTSIYHLSLRRLNLQRQYRPLLDNGYPLPDSSPTALGVAPNRRILLAFGNRIFFASLP